MQGKRVNTQFLRECRFLILHMVISLSAESVARRVGCLTSLNWLFQDPPRISETTEIEK